MAKNQTANQAAPAIESVEALQAAFPELCQQITDAALATVPASPAIETVTDLDMAYPDLCQQIIDATLASVQPDIPVMDKGRGFVIPAGDPFGLAAARIYAKANGRTPEPLPVCLPYKKPGTKAAIADYLIRAQGAGDKPRIEAATEALAKCK